MGFVPLKGVGVPPSTPIRFATLRQSNLVQGDNERRYPAIQKPHPPVTTNIHPEKDAMDRVRGYWGRAFSEHNGSNASGSFRTTALLTGSTLSPMLFADSPENGVTMFGFVRRNVGALIFGTTILSGTLFGGAAAFGSTPASGVVHFVGYGDGAGLGSTIILTGAVGDAGTTFDVDANGAVDPGGPQVELVLVQGSLRLSLKNLNKAIGAAYGKLSLNTNTCSAVLSASAVLPIVSGSGTGNYTGVSGSVKATITEGLVLPKYPSGKHKGQCNESNSSSSVNQGEIFSGSGTVSF